jgi:uncharacterized membrane protein YgdD (TMEM256/DUF423 family)
MVYYWSAKIGISCGSLSNKHQLSAFFPGSRKAGMWFQSHFLLYGYICSMHRKILLFSAVSGLCIVAFGASGAHALRKILDAGHMQVYETAVKYQAYHTLALLGLSILLMLSPSRFGGWAAQCMIAGIVLFSGSLYILSIRPAIGLSDESLKWLNYVTPFGGIAFMAGWVCLFVYALKLKK